MLAAITCFIVDLSGIVDSIKWFIWKIVFKKVGNPDDIRLKPFECSLCMTFWVNLTALLVSNGLTLPLLTEVCLLSLLSKNITGFLRWIQEALVALEMWLYQLIEKP